MKKKLKLKNAHTYMKYSIGTRRKKLYMYAV